ncbi:MULTISPECIES: hypothetical protein [Pseudoalteromonas]|uniref:Uncharacterized protein n=3 Tax=Pseudoalteromonas TaxID=53246 RepID=A0AAD0XCK0_9GAMM|nr:MULTISPECIES: hypothetical protein [Pseudoalteromonas]KAA8601602.1 hypothetical protein F0Z19_1329 [Vibrio cyclitrophicus]MAJ40822.1 hypothetical protein [Pseudoalteromonadaceae bacterium]MCP4061155.1 hypothetical protein [Pseudoalteromonas sp.]MDY6886709.1 hypothetical protein [Pseudomonadota bacterium]OUX85650.1 MAG: hypothetical protein CBC03_12790 [Pseudoalteromonas sp. TMED43]
MKLIFGSILIVVAGFSVNKYVFSSKAYDGVATITDLVANYPVDLFEFKQTMHGYAHHLCYKNEERLTRQNVTTSDCISNHDDKQSECENKVFRLAPLSLETKAEILDYSKQYTECTLPYKRIMG